jgi:hypothetical protein
MVEAEARHRNMYQRSASRIAGTDASTKRSSRCKVPGPLCSAAQAGRLPRAATLS